MSRRQQSKQQRRKCPDFRRTNTDRNSLPPTALPHKGPITLDRRTNKKGVPILSEQDCLADLFGAAEEETSFAETIEQTLTDANILKVLQEKLDNQAHIDQRESEKSCKHYPSPETELDLHGATGHEAETRAAAFITAGYHNGVQSLRIITGKGLHSEGRAVLPDVVEQTVMEFKKKGIVQTFRWEKRAKEKSGAVIVYLR